MDDRLSDLPEHLLLQIISFLPTKIAAETSLLSRRFRRIWEASPVLDLDLGDFRDLNCSDFVDLANRTILHRDPPFPLHRLSLGLYDYSWYDETLLTSSYISSLLLKATSLGLRHLNIDLIWDMHVTVWPLIFSLSSLEFLSVVRFRCVRDELVNLLFPVTLTHLKSLSFHIASVCNDSLNHITSQLNAMEDLHLQYIEYVTEFDLKSATIKRLKLHFMDFQDLKISTPSLEFFEISGGLHQSPDSFQWEMPLLKKAIIQLSLAYSKSVPTICEILKAVAHVDELHLEIEQNIAVGYPFHALLVPGVELPTYVTLKHLNLEVCFHEYNIENLVTLLEHSPALESLKLVHKAPIFYSDVEKMKLWSSKLPQNGECNYLHGYFKDLQIDGKRKVLIEQLTRKISKKL